MKKQHLEKGRFELVDAARGFAILLMFIYHISYDLDYFNFIQQDFYRGEFWLNFRTLIVSLFLIIVGVSIYLASYRGINRKRFFRRLSLLIIYSALVSISSWFMYPKLMIFFGILHFITLASVIALLFTRFGFINLLIGFTLIVLSQQLSFTLFDHPWLQWFGLSSRLPATVDYVPFLPWFGMVLMGMYLGHIISLQSPHSFVAKWQAQNTATKLLTLGGRHSLHIYMLHQPLFLGILYIISQLIR